MAIQIENVVYAWVNNVLQGIELGKRTPVATWNAFKAAMCVVSTLIVAMEESRRQLRNLKQTNRVRTYAQRFL